MYDGLIHFNSTSFVEKDPEIAESSRMHSGSSVTVNRSEDGEEQTEN